MNENHYPEEIYHQYLDQELDPVTRQSLEAHLAGCLVCTQHLTTLEQLFDHVAALPEIDLEIDLTAQVLASLQAVPPPMPQPLRRQSYLQIAAALILLLLSLPFILQLDFPQPVIALPQIQVPAWKFSFDLPSLIGTFSSFQVPPLENWVPTSLLLELPMVDLPTFWVSALLLSTGLLWWFANRIFLVKYSINGG